MNTEQHCDNLSDNSAELSTSADWQTADVDNRARKNLGSLKQFLGFKTIFRL